MTVLVAQILPVMKNAVITMPVVFMMLSQVTNKFFDHNQAIIKTDVTAWTLCPLLLLVMKSVVVIMSVVFMELPQQQ